MNILALGTVQFGLDYGVSNYEGQVTENDVVKILQYAKENGINTLDTAVGYGNSETCLGNIGIEGWRVITKLPEVPKDCDDIDGWINKQIEESLGRLRVKSVTGLMLHRPMQLLEKKGENIWQALNSLKESKIIGKIGFSIYDPSELDKLLDNFKPDIIQAPFNIFDQRLKTSGWLKRLYQHRVEIHIRSVFLQGLLLMPSTERPSKFNRWEKLWTEWEEWTGNNKMTPLEACLGFVKREEMIDSIVIGVNSVLQLKEILVTPKNNITKIPKSLITTDQNLINPTNWSAL
jgi:aryl-alcohol dehydrogenase-like predicted oxidoreductase